VVAEIEQQLARLRAKGAGDNAPVLRTSTMTHVVRAPPSWLTQARVTLACLQDRHPAATTFLMPHPRRSPAVTAQQQLRAVRVCGGGERDAGGGGRGRAAGLDRVARSHRRSARVLPLAGGARVGVAPARRADRYRRPARRRLLRVAAPA